MIPMGWTYEVPVWLQACIVVGTCVGISLLMWWVLRKGIRDQDAGRAQSRAMLAEAGLTDPREDPTGWEKVFPKESDEDDY